MNKHFENFKGIQCRHNIKLEVCKILELSPRSKLDFCIFSCHKAIHNAPIRNTKVSLPNPIKTNTMNVILTLIKAPMLVHKHGNVLRK